MIRPQTLLLLIGLLKVFGELFKEQEDLEELDKGHQLLLLRELRSGVGRGLNRSSEKLLVLLKFEFFSCFQDMGYSLTLRLKLVDDKEPPVKKLGLALVFSSDRRLNAIEAHETESKRFPELSTLRRSFRRFLLLLCNRSRNLNFLAH